MLDTNFTSPLHPAVTVFVQGPDRPLWAGFDCDGVFRCTVPVQNGAGIGVRNAPEGSLTIGANAVMAAYSPDTTRAVWWDGNSKLWIVSASNGLPSQLTNSRVGRLSDRWSPDEVSLPFSVLGIKWSGNDYVAVDLRLGSGDRLIHIYHFDQVPLRPPVLERTLHDTNGIIAVGGREGQFESAQDPDDPSSPRLLWAGPGVANGYFYAKQPDGTHRFKRCSLDQWSKESDARTVPPLPGGDGRGFTLAAQNPGHHAFAFASTEGHLVCYPNLLRGDSRDWPQFDLRDILERWLRDIVPRPGNQRDDPADLRVHDLRWLIGDGSLRVKVAISWRQGLVWYAGVLSFFIDTSR